jgi:cyclomaltodextrinase / maltogenic alpha-amylase / neopullulanase
MSAGSSWNSTHRLKAPVCTCAPSTGFVTWLGGLRKTTLFPAGPSGAESFAEAIERLIGLYSPATTAVMLNLLGSHDMARFVTLARGDRSALRLATLFQMTHPGAPSIYYGDEIGMAGGHDPLNRGAFPWHKTDTWDTDLLHEFQRLIALRRSRPALRRGSFRFLHARDEVIAYARQLGDETIVVAINAARMPRRLDVPLGDILPDGATLEQVWAQRTVRVEQGGLRGVELGPRSGLVLARTAPPSS